MIRGAAARAGALLVGLSCTPEVHDVAVAFHSGQPRRLPVMACDGCTFYDLKDTPASLSEHRILVLDGHSNPPLTVLSLPLANFTSIVRAINPRIVVGVTCRLGELHALERLFAAAPRLETIVASPAPLAWSGYAGVAACLAGSGADERSSCVPGEVFTYHRGDMDRLTEIAHATLSEIHACRAAPVLVSRRRYPPHLCVSGPGLPSVAWRLEYRDLFQRCSLRPPFAMVDTPCTASDAGAAHGPPAP